MDSSLKGRDLMKDIPKMYILYFFGNSLSYLLMDSLRGSVIDKNHVMTSKTYANFVLIAVLTVVSVIADWVWVKNVRKYRSSRPRLIALMVAILILSAIVDYGLMIMAVHFIRDLYMTRLDCIQLAIFCPITSLVILTDLPD